MSDKKRVVLYADLRKKISNMDVYSFEETDSYRKNIPQVSSDSDEEKESTSSPVIKRNTLSLSIEDLIKENENYEANKKKNENVEKIKQKHKISSWIWITVGAIATILVVFLVLIIAGVFNK